MTKVKNTISNKQELGWCVVCGRYEHEELVERKVLKPWRSRDSRQQLFLIMKWPNHTLWRGAWGPEPLLYDKEDDYLRGQLGTVWATDKRAQEIAEWLRDQMFNSSSENG
jgi:hypothetical protein